MEAMATTAKKKKPLTPNRAWMLVILGGLLEVVWASGFKYEQIPVIIVIAALLASFDLIIRASKVLPVGTVYAVFAAMGTVGTTVVEAVMSGGIRPVKVLILLLLLLCIVGLKLTGDKESGGKPARARPAGEMEAGDRSDADYTAGDRG
ncbi:MAG TPA: SMR family transporter [Paenibacillaceae bacterium]